MVFSSQTSRRLLLATVGLRAFAVFNHTSISINELFLVIDASLESNPLVAFSAKSNLLQASTTLVTMGKYLASQRYITFALSMVTK